MEDNLSDLIVTLTKLVEKLDDRSTGEATSKARYNPDDMFAPTEEQVSAKENKELAKEIGKENAKNTKEKKQTRKILKDVTPVSVVNFDSKALKQLGDVVSNNITDKVSKETEESKDETPSWLTALKMIGYGAFAVVIGPIIALFSFFEEISKQKWFLSLKDFLKQKVGPRLLKLFKPITTFFDNIGKKLEKSWKSIKQLFKPITTFFKNVGTSLDDMWKSIKKTFKPVTDFFKNISTRIKGVKDSIMTFLKPIFGSGTKPGLFTRLMNIIMKNPVVKGMTAFFKGLGSVLGKIFLPITIILGVFDFVTGFMDGYEKEGSIIDGIESGITKVFDTLIAMPLDMLKSAVSWILGKFGFTEAEKTLDAFSFSTLISDMIGGIFQMSKDIFNKIGSIFTDIWDSLIGVFTTTGEADEKGMVEKALVFVNKIILLPLDLLKDTVSWLLGAFGFENAEKSLDSWSFSGLFEDLIGAVFGFMEGTFEFVKLLFTEPKKAFEKIGKWFDKLFADPVGTIKALLPTWMTDFGTWVWDTLIAPVASVFTSTAEDPAQAKRSFLNMLPDWMTGFGEWIFDSIILPVSQYFDKLLKAKSASEILSALIPQWLKDTGQWVYDNTIQPLMDLFSAISADPEGSKVAFLKMLPKWMTGIGEWVFDEMIAPIAKWFTDFADPSVGFMELIPDWMKDVGKWVYNTLIKPIGDMVTQLLDIDLLGMMKKKAKDTLPESVYEYIYGTPEEEAAGKAATEREAATKATVSTAGLSETAMQTITSARQDIEESTGGNVTADRTNEIMSAIDEAMEEGKGKYTDTQELLVKELGGQSAYDSLIKASGMDEKAFVNKVASGYESTGWFDGTSEAGDAWIENTAGDMAMTVANQEDQHRRWVSLVNTYANVLKAEGLKLNDKQYMWAQLLDQDQLTGEMVTSYNDMVGKLDIKTDDGRAFKTALNKVGISKAMGEAGLSEDSGTVEMNDFIWRPGHKPMTFSKGDILIGSHQDNVTPTTTPANPGPSGKDMVNRMDKMVELMTEHSSIHTKVLEVLTESGLIDNQGNTVVNNGGNTTTVNNTIPEPGIMDFRDRVVGRLSK